MKRYLQGCEYVCKRLTPPAVCAKGRVLFAERGFAT